VYAIARLMVNVPAGMLGDRHGRKPLLVWGPAITALGEGPSSVGWFVVHTWAAKIFFFLVFSLDFQAERLGNDQGKLASS
jgi:MFS family permease